MSEKLLTNELLNEHKDFQEFDEENIDWGNIDDTTWMDLFDDVHQHHDVCSTCRSVIICGK